MLSKVPRNLVGGLFSRLAASCWWLVIRLRPWVIVTRSHLLCTPPGRPETGSRVHLLPVSRPVRVCWMPSQLMFSANVPRRAFRTSKFPTVSPGVSNRLCRNRSDIVPRNPFLEVDSSPWMGKDRIGGPFVTSVVVCWGYFAVRRGGSTDRGPSLRVSPNGI